MLSANAQRLQLYRDAEVRILQGQSVRFGERQLQRADLAEVRKAITELQAAVDRETSLSRGTGGRFSQADFGGCV